MSINRIGSRNSLIDPVVFERAVNAHLPSAGSLRDSASISSEAVGGAEGPGVDPLLQGMQDADENVDSIDGNEEGRHKKGVGWPVARKGKAHAKKSQQATRVHQLATRKLRQDVKAIRERQPTAGEDGRPLGQGGVGGPGGLARRNPLSDLLTKKDEGRKPGDGGDPTRQLGGVPTDPGVRGDGGPQGTEVQGATKSATRDEVQATRGPEGQARLQDEIGSQSQARDESQARADKAGDTLNELKDHQNRLEGDQAETRDQKRSKEADVHKGQEQVRKDEKQVQEDKKAVGKSEKNVTRQKKQVGKDKKIVQKDKVQLAQAKKELDVATKGVGMAQKALQAAQAILAAALRLPDRIGLVPNPAKPPAVAAGKAAVTAARKLLEAALKRKAAAQQKVRVARQKLNFDKKELARDLQKLRDFVKQLRKDKTRLRKDQGILRRDRGVLARDWQALGNLSNRLQELANKLQKNAGHQESVGNLYRVNYANVRKADGNIEKLAEAIRKLGGSPQGGRTGNVPGPGLGGQGVRPAAHSEDRRSRALGAGLGGPASLGAAALGSQGVPGGKLPLYGRQGRAPLAAPGSQQAGSGPGSDPAASSSVTVSLPDGGGGQGGGGGLGGFAGGLGGEAGPGGLAGAGGPAGLPDADGAASPGGTGAVGPPAGSGGGQPISAAPANPAVAAIGTSSGEGDGGRGQQSIDFSGHGVSVRLAGLDETGSVILEGDSSASSGSSGEPASGVGATGGGSAGTGSFGGAASGPVVAGKTFQDGGRRGLEGDAGEAPRTG